MNSIVSVLKFQATVKKHISNLAKGGNLAVKQLHDARLPTLYTRCLVVFHNRFYDPLVFLRSKARPAYFLTLLLFLTLLQFANEKRNTSNRA